MKKIFLFVLIFSFLFISCGKKGDPYPKRPTAVQIKDWKMTMR